MVKKISVLLFVLAACAALSACAESSDDKGTDTVGDVVGDQLTNLDSANLDTGADTTPDTLVVGVTFTEPGTGLTWTVDPVSDMANRDAAVAACEAAEVDGHTDWRLPTIEEARGLYRDCPDLELGGACTVGDNCLNSTCNDANCKTCQTASSQPSGQCKAVHEMQQGWDGGPWYWTSSEAADVEQYWVFNLCQGALNVVFGGSSYGVRCVR